MVYDVLLTLRNPWGPIPSISRWSLNGRPHIGCDDNYRHEGSVERSRVRDLRAVSPLRLRRRSSRWSSL